MAWLRRASRGLDLVTGAPVRLDAAPLSTLMAEAERAALDALAHAEQAQAAEAWARTVRRALELECWRTS